MGSVSSSLTWGISSFRREIFSESVLSNSFARFEVGEQRTETVQIYVSQFCFAGNRPRTSLVCRKTCISNVNKDDQAG